MCSREWNMGPPLDPHGMATYELITPRKFQCHLGKIMATILWGIFKEFYSLLQGILFQQDNGPWIICVRQVRHRNAKCTNVLGKCVLGTITPIEMAIHFMSHQRFPKCSVRKRSLTKSCCRTTQTKKSPKNNRRKTLVVHPLYLHPYT